MTRGFGFEQPGEGATNEWLTPPRLLSRLGQFDLDPCALAPWVVAHEVVRKGKTVTEYTAHATQEDAQAAHPDKRSIPRPWPTAPRMLSVLDDGLNRPWAGRVWCNPPYGDNVPEWVERMEEHRNGILLVFLRAETDAWRDIFKSADAFLFPHGRTCFYRPDGTRATAGTAPSALVAYGQESLETLRSCGITGAFFRRAELTEGVKISTL